MNELSAKMWESKFPESEGRAAPVISTEAGKLFIEATDSFYSCGTIFGNVSGEVKDGLYSFSAKIKTEGSRQKAYAVVIQLDSEGKKLSGDYMTRGDGNIYTLALEPMKECKAFRIEYTFYSFGAGKAEFCEPVIEFAEKKPHRRVKVATAYFRRMWYKSCDDNLKIVLKIIDKAAADEDKPDIICFTETTYDRGANIPLAEKFIPDNHPAVIAVCEKAREYGMYVIFGFHENENGNLYNTSAVISPEGKIVKKVRKTHLCYDELTAGMIPGTEIEAIELPFGKIGILICWDQWFPGAAKELVRKGAEIIFLTTAGFPEAISRARAYENGVFVVSSGCADEKPHSSFVTDEHGDFITAVDDEEKGYTVATLDLDEHKYVRYLSFENGYGRNLYMQDKREDLYGKE